MKKSVQDNPALMTIFNRRSRRRYSDKNIPEDSIATILEAARWAPSGLNNQPWRFVVIRNDDIKHNLSQLTKYSRILQTCNSCIAVFYNHPAGYNRDKDIMSIGAAIQNMLLAAEALKIGAVWLGEILNKKDDVNRVLEVSPENELMAIVALGYSEETPEKDRVEAGDLLLKTCE